MLCSIYQMRKLRHRVMESPHQPFLLWAGGRTSTCLRSLGQGWQECSGELGTSALSRQPRFECSPGTLLILPIFLQLLEAEGRRRPLCPGQVPHTPTKPLKQSDKPQRSRYSDAPQTMGSCVEGQRTMSFRVWVFAAVGLALHRPVWAASKSPEDVGWFWGTHKAGTLHCGSLEGLERCWKQME